MVYVEMKGEIAKLLACQGDGYIIQGLTCRSNVLTCYYFLNRSWLFVVYGLTQRRVEIVEWEMMV